MKEKTKCAETVVAIVSDRKKGTKTKIEINIKKNWFSKFFKKK